MKKWLKKMEELDDTCPAREFLESFGAPGIWQSELDHISGYKGKLNAEQFVCQSIDMIDNARLVTDCRNRIFMNF